MKKIYNKLILVFSLLFVLGSCTDYLSIPAEVGVQEKDAFGTFNQFQGFVDQIYAVVPCHVRTSLTSDGCYGGETVSAQSTQNGYRYMRGQYGAFVLNGNYNANNTKGYYAVTNDNGIFKVGWPAIRKCNIGLKNLDYLVATQEEKNWIKGQLLFFRAFFHSEMLNAYGSIPYLKEPLSDNYNQPRFYDYNGKKNIQAATEYIVEDFTEAAKLLPVAWPDPTSQLGRATALAALSYKAHALLFAGSPLMNEFSGGAAVVNKEYMTRAAVAADEVIKMAESHPASYGLVALTDAEQNFITTEKIVPWTKETIWSLYNNSFGKGNFRDKIGRVFTPNTAVFGGNANIDSPTQNYVDKFEMADGTLYNPALHDGDNAKRWDGRDPRFRRNIYVDRDLAGIGKVLTMFKGGATISSDSQQTPYVIRKYWPFDVYDAGNATLLAKFNYQVPLMRLAEVYLMYAEAACWAYGNGTNGNVTAPGDSYTALAAVNKVRERAGQAVTTATGGAHGEFIKMILNERAVEFCFEAGQYWHDLRRYKLGESLNQTPVYTLDFDKDWTPSSFVRREIIKQTFEAKNYWMPFPRDLTLLYLEFPQNPGWN